MRIGAVIVLTIIIVLLGMQIHAFGEKRGALEAELATVSKEFEDIAAEYQALEADYQYYENPANLEKELRARFNYRNPDEHMIVIVPKASTTGLTEESATAE